MTNGNSLPRTADIVILGAGVMGASIAFHLAQSKPGSIIVLDKDHVDMGQARGKTVDISPFPPSRFAEGIPIKAEYEYKDD